MFAGNHKFVGNPNRWTVLHKGINDHKDSLLPGVVTVINENGSIKVSC